MNNKTNLIKLINCTQIAEGYPIYEGTCSECGAKVQVVESWVAIRMSRESHNLGLKKGLLLGIGTAAVCGLSMWAISKVSSSEEKED